MTNYPSAPTPHGWVAAPPAVAEFFVDHPVAIVGVVVAVWAGATYGWGEFAKAQRMKGRAVAGLNDILGRLVGFVFRGDTQPVVTRPARLGAKFGWLTGRRLYLFIAAAAAVGFLVGTGGWRALLVLVATIAYRSSKVFRARRGIIMQMFAVAAAECRYPKEAVLRPWTYIVVDAWTHHTNPGKVIVRFPAAYQSEDTKTRDKFERQFNGTVSDANTWTYQWESAKNRVVCTSAAFLPRMAPFPGPGPKWDEIHLGIGNGGKPVVWPIATFPHSLIAGPTGSGKSVLQRMILFHVLTHKDTWRLVGVDPKMVEMGWLSKYDNVLKIAMTLEEGVEVVRSVRDEMMRRYDEMSSLPSGAVTHFQKLPTPPPAIMLMIDETFNFLAPEGNRSEEGKERDALHGEATALLGEILRMGRASGIHCVFATQRPDATVIKGEMKNNLDCRIAAGRLDTTPSLMVLDSESATRLPKITGRGMIRLGGDFDTFQGYFAEQDWFDQTNTGTAAGQDPDTAAQDVSTDAEPTTDSRDPHAPPTGRRGLLARARGGIGAVRKATDSGGSSVDAGGDDTLERLPTTANQVDEPTGSPAANPQPVQTALSGGVGAEELWGQTPWDEQDPETVAPAGGGTVFGQAFTPPPTSPRPQSHAPSPDAVGNPDTSKDNPAPVRRLPTGPRPVR